MSPARRTVYFVPHTHWDREWFQPFEVFRARLVDVVDRVLELLQSDARYRRFTLDGQAVVLDDYLELRPERSAAIAEQVRAGRLRIGPWYVLADEFLVSPEALVRNLALGRATCRRFGPAMPVAYTPDSFGHIAQLPLIAQGFGLDAVVFERGVGDEGERLRGEFTWLAADGVHRVFAVHLLGTYSAAAAIGHRDWELSDAYDPDAARRQFTSFLYGTDALDDTFPDWLRASLTRVDGGSDAYATGAALLMLNGSDHLFPQTNVPDIVRDLDATFQHVDVVHGDVEEFVRAAQAQDAPLESYAGEFRGSRYQHVLSGVLSARMYLKQANHHAETLLERYAEPLAALALHHGAPHPGAQLLHAWRRLLLNHAHDSICGCSIDPVHREMLTRFEQVTQLGDDLCRRAIDHLANHRDDPRDERRDASQLALFNPLPVATTAVLSTDLRLAPGSAATLRVLDADGRALPHQLEVRPTSAPGRALEPREDVHLIFSADLPPLGLTSARVETGGPGTDLPGPVAASVRADEVGDGVVLENEALRLDVDARGAITLVDRANGHAQPLHLRFEDVGDAGDEYDFSPVSDHRAPLTADESLAPPRLVERGPVRAAARLMYRLRVPERLARDRRSREGEASLTLSLTLGLEAGASRVDVSVDLENRADDHRLRVRVASGCQAERVWADGHFHVLERDVRPPSGEGWFQAPTGTNHQRRFVAVSDASSGRGLALLNRGLPEYEAIATETGVDLAVTLLRCVGWLSRDDLTSRPQGAGPALPTPEAQCHGRHRFELALVPFQGDWWEGPLALEAERFVAPARAFAAAAPVSAAGVRLDPPLTLSASKPVARGRGTIVRVWNPAPVHVSGRLDFDNPPREVHLVRLDETREAPLDLKGGGLDLALGPSRVITLELVPHGKEVPHCPEPRDQ